MLKHGIEYSHGCAAKAAPGILKGSFLAVSLIAPLLMTGCASVSKRHFTVGSVQDSYRTRHPIMIDEKEQTLDIPVAANAADLPIAESGAVEGFAFRFRKSGASTITVLKPSGSANTASAKHIGEDIIDVLTSNGVPHNRIRTAVYDASQHGASAPIRLSYVAVAANVGECGKWPEDLAGANVQNRNYTNFGCASQNNLASMIANPSDLIAPRGMSDIDAARRNEVIRDYRQGDIDLGRDLESALKE